MVLGKEQGRYHGSLDNLRIDELGYADDVENSVSPWLPEGFLRIPDTVPEHWSVAIVYDTPTPTVEFMTLDEVNTGRATITVPEGSTATLVIDAMAPFIESQANYKISAVQQ